MCVCVWCVRSQIRFAQGFVFGFVGDRGTGIEGNNTATTETVMMMMMVMIILVVIIIIITASQINSGGYSKYRERRKKVPHTLSCKLNSLPSRILLRYYIYIYIYCGVDSLQFSPLRFSFASNVHSHHISKANHRLLICGSGRIILY